MAEGLIVDAGAFAKEAGHLGDAAGEYNNVQGTYTNIGGDVWGILTELNQFEPCVNRVQAELASTLSAVREKLQGLLDNISAAGNNFEDASHEAAADIENVVQQIGNVQTELNTGGFELDEAATDMHTSAEESETQVKEALEEDPGFSSGPPEPTEDYYPTANPPQDSGENPVGTPYTDVEPETSAQPGTADYEGER